MPVRPTQTRYHREFTKADPQDGTQSRDRNPLAQIRHSDAWIGLMGQKDEALVAVRNFPKRYKQYLDGFAVPFIAMLNAEK